ncbi:CMP-N-acetylneuraminate-poly-alpha-2,8-sialyltransferase-like [Antedon mediterranea]|uniref:CMP-N-acetylneuraminate-poly-alpha-2, 8-sialyltransferase-like n=1 Tax=Antedon mediterranea TaxID=105859 RepID=UPI003AF924D6
MINKSHFNSINFQRDCAIVGNGGILVGSKCGKNINNHAFVLRSNLAPIVNYEDDVGTKTNMTVLNGQIMDEVIDTVDQGALGKTFLDRIQYLNDSILWYSKATEVQFKKHQLQFLSKMLKNKYNLPIRFGYSWRTFDPLTRWFWGTGIRVPHLTTGFNTFTVAVSLCDNITLYGFYPFNYDTNGKPLRYHYYDKTNVLGNNSWGNGHVPPYSNDRHNVGGDPTATNGTLLCLVDVLLAVANVTTHDLMILNECNFKLKGTKLGQILLLVLVNDAATESCRRWWTFVDDLTLGEVTKCDALLNSRILLIVSVSGLQQMIFYQNQSNANLFNFF